MSASFVSPWKTNPGKHHLVHTLSPLVELQTRRNCVEIFNKNGSNLTAASTSAGILKSMHLCLKSF